MSLFAGESRVDGGELRVTQNVVRDVVGAGSGSGYGIAMVSGSGSTGLRRRLVNVSRNQVSNGELSESTGIFLDASTDVTVNDNQLSTLNLGIVFANGSTGTYSGNVMTDVITPVVGGTPAP